MWRTPEGTRVLQDLEAEVARRGLETAVELIEHGIAAGAPWEFGVALFDALTPEQQLQMLADVGRALLYKSVRAPIHTAINEACVYVIFRALEESVQLEIDGCQTRDKSTRDLIYEFVAEEMARDEQEAFDGADDNRITPDCDEIEKWAFEIDCLADRILWDRDWELDDLMVDGNPEKSQLLKLHLGIDGEYFTSIAPDPRDLTQARRELQQLMRERPR